ncbi:MAG: hypothetical protein NC489_26280 [Ruminococcus flavefaciens]|nr:hypothetical protein [Ruminococcus flavefaciens]
MERPTINGEDQDMLSTENMQQEDRKPEEDSGISKGTERIEIATDCRISNFYYMNWQNSEILSFGDILFVRNTEYLFEDGEYYLSGKRLTDYLPEEDQEELLALIENHVWRILQSDHTIIYSLDRGQGEYCVTLVDFPAKEVKCSRILPGEIQCVYDSKLYYISTNESDDGRTLHTIEYLDCNDFTSHAIYSTENVIGQMMVREDGAIAFAEDVGGYFVIDEEGNINRIHEAIPERLGFAKEQFYRFDDAGLWFWIEYYNHAMELIRLEENGELRRIKSNGASNELALKQGMLIYDGNEAKLYPYQYETMAVEGLTMRGEIIWDSFLQQYQIIDSTYLDSGYKLTDYYYQNQTIWWLWKNEEENLIVTKVDLNESPD